MDEERTKAFVRALGALGEKTQQLEVPGVVTTLEPDLEEPTQLDQLRRQLGELPVIRVTGANSAPGEIVVSEVLGQGGMGIVYRGVQRTIGRDVAVKALQPHRDEELTRREILREAWIAGRLEHPNIVPVHALGRDASGKPIIVMKRVEGRPWFESIEDPERLPEQHRGVDPLEAHLRILMQVCNAIHFAHTRGIVHRDIKPENVMLGAFGEVYVLDWGIAVSTLEVDAGRLPLAREVTQPAGTPGYMAPEMVEGVGVGVHSDIYLLGAVLHEVLTGEPRHRAGTMRASMLSSFVSEPFDYSKTPEVPEELGQLANEAMAKEPADRVPSAERFRQRLETYLHRRESHVMRQDGDARAERVRATIATVEEVNEDVVRAVRRESTEALFAYQRALEIWPDNEKAKKGMSRMICELADVEITRGDLASAEGLLAMLGRPPQELVARLDELRERKRADAADVVKAKRIRRESDVRVASRQRALAVLLALLLWTAGGVVRASVPYNPAFDVAVLWVVAGLTSAVVYGLRGALFATRINRQMVWCLLMAVFSVAGMRTFGSLVLEVPLATGIFYERMLAGAMIGMAVVVFDARVLRVAWVMPLAAALVALFPQHTSLFTNASNAIVFGGFGWLWFGSVRGQEDQQT